MPMSDEPHGEAVYEAPPAFSPYDPEPEPVQPTSTVPPREDPGDVGDTSGEDGEAAEERAQAPDEEPLPEFDPRYAEPFRGLLYVGRLSETFTHLGHVFVIKTLTTEELAEIALLVKPYDATRAQNPVYQSAVVAAAVVSVDGKPITEPLSGRASDSDLEPRFRYVMRSWMPALREEIWRRIFALEETARKVIEQMGNATG